MRLTSLAVALTAVVALAFVPVAAAWTWPAEGPVLRPFSVGNDPYAGGQHRGVDIGAAERGTVRAPVTGRVSFAGTLPRYGRTVTIRADGLAVTLLHLGELAVARGTDVAEGQAIALAGPTGDVEHPTPYVHLGVRHGDDDNGYVDPLTLLPPRAPPAEPAPAPAPAPTIPEPIPVAATAVPPPVPTVPGTAAPAVSATAPPEPVSPLVPAAPTPEPVGVAVVPRNQPAAPVALPAASGGAVTHSPGTPARRVTDRSARSGDERSRPQARLTAAAQVHALPARTESRPAEARPRAGRPPQRRLPRQAARMVRPRLGPPVARADAPAARTPRQTPTHHGWARGVVLGLTVLAAVMASAVRRRWKRAVPAVQVPCSLGRRSTAARPCSRRLPARVPACRPSTRPRAGPRPVTRRRRFVPA
jgi:hypothetical protein